MKRILQVSTSALLISALAAGSMAAAAPASPVVSAAGSVKIAAVSASELAGATSPRWISDSSFLVTVFGETEATDYLVNAATSKAEPIIEGVSGLAVSPDGKWGAYASDVGHVYLVNLAEKTQEAISTNEAEKFELQFSSDGKKLYYIEGSKAAIVSELDLETKKIAKIIDDKVENKMDLRVSEDGKRFVYAVEKVGKTTVDSSKPVEADALEIDVSAADTQIHFFNKGMAKPGPYVAVQDEANKTSLNFFGTDYAVFVSSDTQSEASSSRLKKVNLFNNSAKTMLSFLDVQQVETAGGFAYVLGTTQSGKTVLYQVEIASNKKNVLLSTDAVVLDIVVSPNGSVIATTLDGEQETLQFVRDGALVPVF
ncbi:hypothetical protein [Paenibacillus sp.]|uniref:TolB family protein n=1 Tax=Paenibacillus sp. TaxID=58172 RepID=UPI002D62696D|nr:hypothetical protein [Paenibacillus sp.]HZG83624.1 hypothetical protein [Paenibacillus sp.]